MQVHCGMTNFIWNLLLVILLIFMTMNGLMAYRIIEWSPVDGGSGSGEEIDEPVIKTKTNLVILNEIEGDKAEPPSPDDTDHLKELRALNPGLKLTRSIATPEPESNESKQQLQSCLTTDNCSDQQTCNLYSRKCERCRIKMEICRRDENCCDNMRCLWGRCINPKTDGSEGSICKTFKDCSQGLCCAKEHGVSMCKKYLAEGEDCEVPSGGLVFSIHHSCPCIEGLRCKITRRNRDFVELKGTCVK